MSIISAIDIGTNTLLMVTVRANDDGSIEVLNDEHRIGRLGKGVDADGHIEHLTFDRIAGILCDYRKRSDELGAERIVAYGTSALRDAENRDEFIEEMKKRTGITIGLLSGKEEAELTWRGALFGMEDFAEPTVVADIGGGSTEIGLGRNGTLQSGVSIDIGAVRLSERYFECGLPPLMIEIDNAVADVREQLERGLGKDRKEFSTGRLVGVAGTVTTLAGMYLQIEEFDADRINGLEIPAPWIIEATRELLTFDIPSILTLPHVHPGRADILPGGALILREILSFLDADSIICSTHGLRYGIALNELH